MHIEDPQTKQGMKVDKYGQGLVVATGIQHAEHHNQESQRAWSLPFDGVDPTGADDYFFYLENTGTKILTVSSLQVGTTVKGILEVHRVSGSGPTGGTTLTPVNKYLGNTNVPDAVCEYGVDITDLDNEGVLDFITLPADNGRLVTWDARIVIPQGQAIALLWDTATGVLSGAMHVFEH